ncbi:MAG: hypothetical protein V2I43_01620 [Parvularcula sp.]|jgi:hypothetical protein|nr:hypothetical protein [Parvularcula sp.]
MLLLIRSLAWPVTILAGLFVARGSGDTVEEVSGDTVEVSHNFKVAFGFMALVYVAQLVTTSLSLAKKR